MKKRKIQQSERISSALFILVLSILTGCTSINEHAGTLASTSASSSSSSSTSTDTGLVQTSTSFNQVVVNANIVDPNANGTEPAVPIYNLSLAVNTSLSGFQPMTTFCSVTDVTKGCSCKLSWVETNTVGNNSQPVSRTKNLPATGVQAGSVTCAMTQAFWAEIIVQTVVSMSIAPTSSNTSGLSSQALSYRRGTVTPSGDFVDSSLTSFQDIHHYTCYSRRTSSYEILSMIATPSAPTSSSGTPTPTPSTPATAPVGSRFCGDPTGSDPNCNGAIPRNGYSAQNYYRNLFVRSDRFGTINNHNDYYDCPMVQEDILHSSGDPALASPSATPNYWPLDSSFAVALNPSSVWSVPITATSIASRASGSQDETTSELCTGDSYGNHVVNHEGLLYKCLGYGQPPKPDGSCGTITDNTGRVRPLTRLRRFRAIYPATYNYQGKPTATNALEADEVYIADRLVTNNLGVATGEMIFGPKPCNFAWFDHEGVVNRDPATNPFFSHFYGGKPAYVGTNNYMYHGLFGLDNIPVNPDGLIFPNVDSSGQIDSTASPIAPASAASCSATLPVVNWSSGTPSSVRLVTTNASRQDKLQVGSRQFSMSEVHVRPVDPWSPNYVEDTSFKACVPLSKNFTEPPLHFYQTTYQGSPYMAWCSMNYPTQNPYFMELNKKRQSNLLAPYVSRLVGYPNSEPVKHYTSFNRSDPNQPIRIKNNGPECKGTQSLCTTAGLLQSGESVASCQQYLGEGAARNTCDRTVVFAGMDFQSFPLEAGMPVNASTINTHDTTQMMVADSFQNRSYGCTYSVSPDTSKLGRKTPSSGCCGYYNGTRVLEALMNPSINVTGKNDAHLEPFVNPAFPNSRFCGNPVQ